MLDCPHSAHAGLPALCMHAGLPKHLALLVGRSDRCSGRGLGHSSRLGSPLGLRIGQGLGLALREIIEQRVGRSFVPKELLSKRHSDSRLASRFVRSVGVNRQYLRDGWALAETDDILVFGRLSRAILAWGSLGLRRSGKKLRRGARFGIKPRFPGNLLPIVPTRLM